MTEHSEESYTSAVRKVAELARDDDDFAWNLRRDPYGTVGACKGLTDREKACFKQTYRDDFFRDAINTAAALQGIGLRAPVTSRPTVSAQHTRPDPDGSLDTAIRKVAARARRDHRYRLMLKAAPRQSLADWLLLFPSNNNQTLNLCWSTTPWGPWDGPIVVYQGSQGKAGVAGYG